ncbi:MAG: type II secretion system protein [Planctomycetota bacterium]
MTRRAFTLLEILLAVALLGIVTAGLVAFLESVADQRSRLSERVAQERDAEALLVRIERALLTSVAGGGTMGSGVTVSPASLAVLSIDHRASVPPELIKLVIRSPTLDADLTPTIDDPAAFLFDGPDQGFDLPPTDQAPEVSDDPLTIEITGATSASSLEGELPAIHRVAFRAHDGGTWTNRFDVQRAGRLPAAIEVSIWLSEGTPETPDRRRVFSVPGGGAR